MNDTIRFHFKLNLPGNMAPHDWHPEGSVNYILRAQIFGCSARLDPRVGTTNPLGYEQGIEPRLPTYDDISDIHVDLSHDIEVRKSMTAVYDPKPDKGFIDLEALGEGDTPGLGVFKMLHYSNLVSSRHRYGLMIVVRRCLDQDPLGISRPLPFVDHLCRPSFFSTKFDRDHAR
jgi:hypothetical protein